MTLDIIKNINLDLILSDTQMLIGVLLIFFAAGLFLYGLIKFFRSGSQLTKDMILPVSEDPMAYEAPEPIRSGGGREETHKNPIKSVSSQTEPESPTDPVPESPAKQVVRQRSDETMIMAPGVSDMQAQMDIIITQIKNLNKRFYQFENQIEKIESHADVRMEVNELKDPPVNAADFSQKLLKVVEHVIVLEKDVEQLKLKSKALRPTEQSSSSSEASPSSPDTKPPIMPL